MSVNHYYTIIFLITLRKYDECICLFTIIINDARLTCNFQTHETFHSIFVNAHVIKFLINLNPLLAQIIKLETQIQHFKNPSFLRYPSKPLFQMKISRARRLKKSDETAV